jgi:tyrosyl-tRNA synthetase
MTDPSPLDRLLRGIQQVISRDELQSKLNRGKPLRIKLGVDPTAPDLHLGHTVTLNKLRQFQDLGHTVVFILGDYTARIGDPSGRSETRPPMSPEDVEKNGRTYLEQVFKILDEKKTEVRRNAEWLVPLFANQNKDPRHSLLGVLSQHTVQQLTEREDFAKRMKEGNPVSLLELLYPLMQGYDSVAVRADVELGGTDQLFNLLMGREMQKDNGQEPQVVMTLPLLEGTDGVKKMSKSYGNTIALNDPPAEMFGKMMSVSDDLMWKYYELLTEESLPEVKSLHPMEAKKRLAQKITALYHGDPLAKEARMNFENIFSNRNAPTDIPEHPASRSPIRTVDLLVESGLAPSKNEARRLLQQGAVEVAGERIKDDIELVIHSSLLLKVGKRQFRKIRPPAKGNDAPEK